MIEFFFHLRPKKIPKEAIKFSNTFGLGGITTFLFILTSISGILLMFYYTPSTQNAYFDVKRLTFIIPYGSYLRDIHRFCGELMIPFAFLHMFRVLHKRDIFKNKYRVKNWKFGVILFLLIFPLNFTGYVLIYDKVSFWGASIVLNAINEIPIIGEKIVKIFFGETQISDIILTKFYCYHIVVLPLFFLLIFSLHIYYVRKAGGIKVNKSMPKIEIKELLMVELISIVIFFSIINFIVLFIFNAPLGEFAKTSNIPKIIKAPWYFWNFQLFLMYLPPYIPAFLFPLGYVIFLFSINRIKLNKLLFGLIHFIIIASIIVFKFL